MATRQRLTKRQIKEDKFVTNLLMAQEYVSQNVGKFLIGIAALVAVVVVAFLLIRSSQSREREANELLGVATVELRSGRPQLAAVDFQRVLDEYGRTDAAKLASFYLANTYFGLKNYDQAGEYFKLHLDKHRVNDMLTAGAMAGLAHCHRARGEMKEAADLFARVYEKYPKSYIATDCLYLAAESYAAAGDSAGARKGWDKVKKLPGQSQRSMELQQLLVEKGVLDPAIETYK